MERSLEEKARLRRFAYAVGFFLSFSTALGAYVNSSFIEQFVGQSSVGLVYAVASVVSIMASIQVLKLVHRLGNQWTIVALVVANLVALLGTSIWAEAPFAIFFVGAYIVLSFLAAVNLDIYLEELSDDRQTGRIRGFFLTLSNLAWLCSPLLASAIVTQAGYSSIYLVAGLVLLPCLFFAARYLADTVARRAEHVSLTAGFARIFGRGEHDLRRIILIDFLLNFFYATMIIYMPLYLREQIHLAWPQIGLIFTAMLLPFVVLDLPLGRIADLWLGEKELLTLGLLITALASFLVAPIGNAAVIVWALVLLLTRIGAATVETMKETYLFKHIDGRDANIVFLSRNMYPLAYIIAPLVASAFLLFAPLPHLFTLLGFIMLLGIPVTLRLKDTR